MTLKDAKTKQDIIDLIHNGLISMIPNNQLDRIAQAILAGLLVKRQQALADPLDIPVDFVYNTWDDKLTRIEIDGAIYDIGK